jgi:archaellum component FlaC
MAEYIQLDIADIKADIRAIRTDIREEVKAVTEDLGAFRSEYKTDINLIREEVKAIREAQISDFRLLSGGINSHTRWFIGIVLTVAIGICAAVIDIIIR